MRLLGQFQTSLFSLRKDFEHTKMQIPQNKPTKTKISEQKITKLKFFCVHKTSKRTAELWCFLYAQNLFVKKINSFEIDLITSFAILLIQKLTSYFFWL